MKEIDDKIRYESSLTDYVNTLRLRSDKDKLKELSKIRNIPIEEIENSGIFYISNMVEMLLPDYISNLSDFGVISNTNNKPIFNNRWVIPIRDVNGLILNLVGYSPYENERYIYGTARYYRRRDSLYGLENLNLAYKLGYAILTEGITDAIRLRSIGFKNSFAMCGTQESKFIMQQLNRCRHGVIKIPDRDKAGLKAEKGWQLNRAVTLKVSIEYKDVDEMLRDNTNLEIFMEYINYCIDYLKGGKNRGFKYTNYEATII